MVDQSCGQPVQKQLNLSEPPQLDSFLEIPAHRKNWVSCEYKEEGTAAAPSFRMVGTVTTDTADDCPLDDHLEKYEAFPYVGRKK